MSGAPGEVSAEVSCATSGAKLPWRKPAVVIADLEETETGILIGPEILILLS